VDPFATLGIEPAYTVDLASLEKRHRELSRALHPDRYASASPSERRTALSRAADVNEAWRIVRDPVRRAEAILSMRGVPVGQDKEPKPDPELLMEMMEARETLAEARDDQTKLDAIVKSMRGRFEQVERELARALAEERNDDALAKLGELRFVRRLLLEAEDAL
jgi:molecular chaperone HscB